MPIKRSAMLLLVIAISSVSLLVFSAHTVAPVANQPVQVKCCQQIKESEINSPWDIMSPSMLKTKA